MIEVSVIVVVRNEENYIIECIKSIEQQFESDDPWELIIVDGKSEDNTKKLAYEYLKNKKYQWKILDNPKKILASGWNIGIKNSEGKYVIRPDAHSKLGEDYIKIGMSELKKRTKDKVVCVGGVLINKGKGFWGEAIADLFSSKFGVGNSKFRVGVRKPEYTDTAVFGIYDKKVFFDIGFFNENMKRNQDIELHKRFLQKGFHFLTHPDMKVYYFVRNTLKDLIKKAYNDGYWIILSGFHFRHIIPFFFVLYLISVPLGLYTLGYFYLTPLFLYFLPAIFFSIKDGSSIKNRILLFILFPIFHISYGVGTFVSFFKHISKKLTRNLNEN